MCVHTWLLDLLESGLPVTGSVEAVQLAQEQIALYKGSREYQAITIEHYTIGNCLLSSYTYIMHIQMMD